MSKIYYSPSHEYVAVDDGIATIGITAYAQSQLGDIVFVELPEVGSTVTKGEDAGVIESVKAASELVAPVSGEVVEINGDLEAEPGKVNEDPEASAWFIKVKLSDASEMESLMDGDAYTSFIA